jgi:hypothetical protein
MYMPEIRLKNLLKVDLQELFQEAPATEKSRVR